jgi:hypothetical protein
MYVSLKYTSKMTGNLVSGTLALLLCVGDGICTVALYTPLLLPHACARRGRELLFGGIYCATKPPSTFRVIPVIHCASSLARYTAALA